MSPGRGGEESLARNVIDFTCGGAAGAVTVLVGQPLDTAKVLMQASSKVRHEYNGIGRYGRTKCLRTQAHMRKAEHDFKAPTLCAHT